MYKASLQMGWNFQISNPMTYRHIIFVFVERKLLSASYYAYKIQ